MRLTEQEVRYVAALANLNLSDQEVAKMCEDLGEVLTHMEKLTELDTAGVEPMAQVLYDAAETATLGGHRPPRNRPRGRARQRSAGRRGILQSPQGD